MDAVTLLWWVTGIYLVVLALVVAATGLAVLFYAWRIGTTLRKIADGLAAVRGHTDPLGAHVGAANDGLAAIAGSLAAARDHLVATDRALGAVVPDQRAHGEVA